MATGGVVAPGWRPPVNQRVVAPWTQPSSNITGAYSAAVNQNAEDYDSIMGNYRNIFSQAQSNASRPPVTYNPIEAELIQAYQPSAGMQDVSNRLTQFADTGGYTGNELAAFRGRGLAPIRSIFATALQNAKRQKALQGGYSPNFGALLAKMAREQSGILAQKNIDLEAEIADRVQEGRRFGLSTLAPLAARESELAHNVGILNANARNRVNELNANLGFEANRFNAGNISDSLNQALAATQGMTSLYGTTPALSNMFGSQVLQSNQQNLAGQQAAANVRQQRANTGVNLANSLPSPTPSRSTSGGTLLTPPPQTTLSPNPYLNRNVMLGNGPRGALFNYSSSYPRLG